MTVAAQIVGESQVKLWGLEASERLRRQLRSAGVEMGASSERVLLLHLRQPYRARLARALQGRSLLPGRRECRALAG